jgi:hypothetical protein
MDAFNAHMLTIITPGPTLTVDECISPWEGLCHKYVANGAPHITKIQRKPRGVGHEFKATADAISKIILLLELCEGEAIMKTKEYYPEYGATTGTTVRITKPWHGTGRTVIGDSWFASVKTLIALMWVGLFFIGIVKTAHSRFPLKFLQEWDIEVDKRNDRGIHKLLKSTYKIGEQVHEFFALCWADKKGKNIITNVGTTLPGAPSLRPRHRKIVVDNEEQTEKYWKSIPRPHMIELMFSGFAAIDINDHLRQGSISFHTHWLTPNWWHRMYSTILGVIITNSFMLYIYEFPGAHLYDYPRPKPMNFTEFLDSLAYDLIHSSRLPDIFEPVPVNPRPVRIHQKKVAKRTAEEIAEASKHVTVYIYFL